MEDPPIFVTPLLTEGCSEEGGGGGGGLGVFTSLLPRPFGEGLPGGEGNLGFGPRKEEDLE